MRLISKNYDGFREALNFGLLEYRSYDDLIVFLKTLNPLLLMGIPQILGSDPMDQSFKFNDFVKHVDELHYTHTV